MVEETLSGKAVRLGFQQVKGLSRESAKRLVQARLEQPFISLSNVASRAYLSEAELRLLGLAGAFESLGVSRREAAWQARF
ncbi:hypothetical protein HMPREF0044_1075 [Gleimia coleocanis DSM 15436]|uniref:DNA polymerase helix-hairpin-helix motif domain-containing protein n=1 Tax=Gleimia coleocanis DSM 15436 TaxID=525245 RepID=C0W0J7_9ACTO|nr:hypothetical protein [Gleimia coleocanis]EEH64056.1 hypothetical protein HMPREF0044_1075 [Gleimia coleocanis DSM 15436]